MRIVRLLLLAAGGLALILGGAVAVAFNSTFQTWLVRRTLASRPELHLQVGAVAVGLNRVAVRDLRVERAGATIIVPAIEGDVPVLAAAISRRFALARIAGRGFVLDLTKTGNQPGEPPAAGAGAPAVPGPIRPAEPATSASAVAVGTTLEGFGGIFAQLALPCDVTIDGVDLEGEAILPEAQGRVKLALKGGGFHPGRDGRLEIAAHAALANARVSAVDLRAALTGTMDSPRSFGQLTLKFDTTAQGSQFPAGVGLAGELMAARVVTGESYAASVATPGGEILRLRADLPRGSGPLTGTWKINMRDDEIAPFALGTRLPAFTIAGAGDFDADAAHVALHASGRIGLAADRLEVVRPEFAAVGPIRIDADFDLGARGGVVSVQRLAATVASAQPVATIRALQAFDFNPATGELKATDPARDLVGISLLGVPIAWAGPFLRPLEAAGEGVRGELVAIARGGGLGMRSTAPISIGALSVARGAQRFVDGLDLAFGATLDYNPKGWQVEVENFVARRAGATVLTFAGRAGQLVGKDSPLKTTARIAASLPALLALPAAHGAVALSRGELTMSLAASLGTTREIHAQLELGNLETVVAEKPVRLPALAADLRADVTANGKTEFNVPVTITMGERKSDLVMAGNIAPGVRFPGRVEARITSNRLVIDDARSFAAVLPGAPPQTATAAEVPPTGVEPPWAGLEGTATVQLQLVEYSDSVRATNVNGRIDLEAGKIKLDGVQAGLGESGRVNLSGALSFEAARPQPYALEAAVEVRDFDPGPLFQAASRGQPAIVEGRFNASSRLTSQAKSIASLAADAGGEFQLSSKGGVFRGLPANTGQVVASTGRVAGLLAAAGNAVGGLTGKRDPAALASRAQAVAEFVAGLNPIAFDQLSVVLSREEGDRTTLRDFTLIAPEVRLAGSGTMQHRRGTSLLEDSLAMDFKLRARGRQGELLKYLGALETSNDDLGYAGCAVPIRIGGTVGAPDASDLSGRLAALAAEKAGVTDKAAELFNKLIGGGK